LLALHGEHRRTDCQLLFVSEFTALACMRISSRRRRRARGQAEVAARLRRLLDRGFDPGPCDLFRQPV